MVAARKVLLRVKGARVAKARLRYGEKGAELVIAHPLLGKFVINESFTLELLELVHPYKIRSRLPNGGWRRVSLRMFIALLRNGIVRVLSKTST